MTLAPAPSRIAAISAALSLCLVMITVRPARAPRLIGTGGSLVTNSLSSLPAGGAVYGTVPVVQEPRTLTCGHRGLEDPIGFPNCLDLIDAGPEPDCQSCEEGGA